MAWAEMWSFGFFFLIAIGIGLQIKALNFSSLNFLICFFFGNEKHKNTNTLAMSILSHTRSQDYFFII
jgi:hypothetical protein